MTNVTASLPERLADAEGELPEEIVKAINAFERATGVLSSDSRDYSKLRVAPWDAARAVLTAAILARLTAAESTREAANFMAESWKATAEAEAEIGNERAAEARVALARAERAEKALTPFANADCPTQAWDFHRGSRDLEPDELVEIKIEFGEIQAARAALAHPATAEETSAD